MKWADVRRVVKDKLKGRITPGTRHDQGWVPRMDGTWLGYVSICHGDGELKPREVGNCSHSLFINEHNFKQLVACPLAREEFCAMADARAAILIRP